MRANLLTSYPVVWSQAPALVSSSGEHLTLKASGNQKFDDFNGGS